MILSMKAVFSIFLLFSISFFTHAQASPPKASPPKASPPKASPPKASPSKASPSKTEIAAMKRAIIRNDINQVKNILDKGFNVNTPGIRNWTPLIYAAYYGRYEIADFLLKRGADPNLRGKYGETALIEASCEGRGGAKMVQLLIDKGAKIDIVDVYGYVALDYARASSRHSIIAILKK